MLTIKTTTRYGRHFLNVYFPPSSQWKRFFGTSRTPQILEISWYYTSCVISQTRYIPLWKVGTRDRDDHLKWKCHHWQKYHFWTKSFNVTSITDDVVNPLIYYMSMLHGKSPWYSQSNLKEKIWLLPEQDVLNFTSIETGTKLCSGII